MNPREIRLQRGPFQLCNTATTSWSLRSLWPWISVAVYSADSPFLLWNVKLLKKQKTVFGQLEIFSIGQKMSGLGFPFWRPNRQFYLVPVPIFAPGVQIMSSSIIDICKVFSFPKLSVSSHLSFPAMLQSQQQHPCCRLLRKSRPERNSVTLFQDHIMSKGEARLRNNWTATTGQIFWVIPFQLLLPNINVCFPAVPNEKAIQSSSFWKSFTLLKFLFF